MKRLSLEKQDLPTLSAVSSGETDASPLHSLAMRPKTTREARLAEIRSRIEDGSYRIASEQTASKLMESMSSGSIDISVPPSGPQGQD